MGHSREFFSIHTNLFCPWNTYMVWEYLNDWKKGIWELERFHPFYPSFSLLFFSFYFWVPENWESKVTWSKVTEKSNYRSKSRVHVFWFPMQCFTQYIQLLPNKDLYQNKLCAKRCFIAKLFSIIMFFW